MIDGYWLPVRDGDLRALALYRRHYSAAKRRGRQTITPIGNRARFAGPCAGGASMVLLTRTCDALFVWRHEQFRRDGEGGINCAVFRNDAHRDRVLSSTLIVEASELAWTRWPGQRLWTFVDPTKVRTRLTNKPPGYCFLMAGWRWSGRTTPRGLLVFECLPQMVEAVA
jgi:hypothetical protein